MKHILIWLLAAVAAMQTYAQNTGTIQGSIQNSRQEPLAGISIQLAETKYGVLTDDDGYFSLKNIPAGNYTLLITSVGYKLSRQNIVVKSGEFTNIDLRLDEASNLLADVTVVANNRLRYNKINTLASTRTATRNLDIPQSIQTIPRQVIKDQQALSINELTRNMTGVTTPTNLSIFTMRGFPTYEDGIMYNGIRGNMYLYHQNAPLWNVENVDVVRGPASALFSAGSPGGIININTKQPLREKKYALNYAFGSWGTHDISVDATGPLSKDKRLQYRFVAGYLDKKSFRDFYHRKILTIAPTLAYHFNDRSQLTIEYLYNQQKDVLPYDRGTFVTKNNDGSYNWDDIDISFNHGSKADWGNDKTHSVTATFNHRFSDKLKLTVMTRYINSKFDMAEHYGEYGGDPEKTDTLFRRWDNWHWRPYNFQTSAFAVYTAGKKLVRHTILGGIDVSFYGNTRNNYIDGRANPFVDAYNADYSKDIWSSYPLANDETYFVEDDIQKYRLLGGYVQDQVAIGDKIKLMIAARYDHYYSTNTPASADNYTQDADSSIASAFLPRFGVVYQPKKNIAFYGSYTESFLPQYSNNASAGGPFPPQKGVQYEVGYKGDFFGNRLSTMLALYTLTYKNVLANDPTDPTGLRQVPVSGVKSNGLELTVQGNIKNFSTIIGYAYNDTKLLANSSIGNKGDKYANAPEHVANVWLKYDFTIKTLRGLGLGLGSKFVDKRVGVSYDQDFVLPSYTLLDAMITYRLRNFTITANAYNLLNKIYGYGGYYSTMLILPGDPRNFRLGVNYSF